MKPIIGRSFKARSSQTFFRGALLASLGIAYGIVQIGGCKAWFLQYLNEIVWLDDQVSLQANSAGENTTRCSRRQIQRGHWKAIDRSEGPLYFADLEWENSCSPARNSLLPYQDWEWTVEDDCRFSGSFDANLFCQLNFNQTIAFLGDSITWQQFQSLNYLLRAVDVYRSKSEVETMACHNNSTKILWKRDNSASESGLNRLIQRFHPDVLILNRGAHYVPDHVLKTELNATLARAFVWQKECLQRKENCLLVWRTTAPGFPDCTNRKGPMPSKNRSQALEMIDGSNPWYDSVRKGENFHWWDIPHQNRLVEELIRDFQKIHQEFRISVVDFFDMAILRPDHHIGKDDCLHWCLPGPIDAANTVLLHEIMKAGVKRNEPL